MPRNEKTTRTAATTADKPARTGKAAAQLKDAEATPAAEPKARRRKQPAAEVQEPRAADSDQNQPEGQQDAPAAEAQQDTPAAERQQDAPAAEAQQDAPADSDQNQQDGTGLIQRVMNPAEITWDPDVDGGREDEEYSPTNAAMADLINSMRAAAELSGLAYGNDTPVKARFGPDGEVLLVLGRRRHTAATILGQMLLVDIEPTMSLRRARIVATTENNQQAGVSAWGEARQFRGLAQTGMSEREIATAVGKGQAHVNRRMAVLDMPPVVHGMIRSGILTFTKAYSALYWAMALPEPVATVAWATLGRKMEYLKKPTEVQVRDEMRGIVRTLTHPLDPRRVIGQEVPPRFDLDAHAAGCDCGAPVLQLSEHVPAAPRCCKPDNWEALQVAANAAKRNGNASAPAASRATSAPPSRASSAPASPASSAPASSSPASNAPASSAPARSAAPADEEAVQQVSAGRYPTWDAFRSQCGPMADSMVLVREFRTADLRADSRSATLAPALVDWNVLPAAGTDTEDAVRIIQSAAGAGSYAIVCVDNELLTRAKRSAHDAVTDRAEQIREHDRARFSEKVSTWGKGNGDAMLACIISQIGNVPKWFGANTAQMLGLDVEPGATVEEVAALLTKRDLNRVVFAMGYRIMEGDTGLHDDDAEDRARDEVREEFAADFAAYAQTLTLPGEDGAEQDAGAQDAPAATAEAEAPQQDGAEQDAGAQDAPAATAEAEAPQQDGAEQDAGAQDAPAATAEAEAPQQDGAEQDAGAQDAPAATAEAEAPQQDGAEQDAGAQDAPAATAEAEAPQQDGAEQDAGAQDAPAATQGGDRKRRGRRR